MGESSKKILVIDDETGVRRFVTERLQRSGYATVAATDGRDGLRRFYSDRPDLIVLDISMPGMDGWKGLERLREVSNGRRGLPSRLAPQQGLHGAHHLRQF